MARQYYKLSELIAAIKAYNADASVEATMHARIRIGGSASQLARDFKGKSANGKRYFLGKLEKAAREEANPYRQLLFHNVLMRMDFSYQRFLRAINALRTTRLGSIEAHATWYSLYVHRFTKMQAFTQAQWQKSGYLLRATYAPIVRQFKDQHEALLSPTPAPRPQGERYLICVSEFMEQEHPLTRHVIDLADAIISESGAEVMIVNAATPPRLPVSYFGDHTMATVVDAFNTVRSISYGERTIPFAQNPNILLNARAFEWYGKTIAEFAPTGVIAVGPGNILADCFSAAYPTLAFPHTGEIPLSHATTLCGVDLPTAPQMRLIERAGVAMDRLRKIPTTHRLPVSGLPPTKEALGLPAGARAALIVGMRLETECDPRFLSILNDAAERHADLHFVFAGPLGKRKQFLDAYPSLSAKARLLGMQEDVLAITRACDLFINPFRQGGGTSALYALSAGLPVITLNDGDVAKVCDHRFCAGSREAFAQQLDEVLTDAATYDARRAFGLARWQEKSDLGAMVSALMDVWEDMAEDVPYLPLQQEGLPAERAAH